MRILRPPADPRKGGIFKCQSCLAEIEYTSQEVEVVGTLYAYIACYFCQTKTNLLPDMDLKTKLIYSRIRELEDAIRRHQTTQIQEKDSELYRVLNNQ